MDPVSAVGLGSSIIQIVDFTGRILTRGHEIYKSVDGKLEHHSVVENSVRNLRELTTSIRVMVDMKPWGFSKAEKQLLELGKECEALATKLQQNLSKVQSRSGGGEAWASVYLALRSIWSDTKIMEFQNQLERIRAQIHTALLVSLREAMDEWSRNGVLRGDALEDEDLEERKRHEEILRAIREKNWQPSRKEDVAGFSSQLDSAVELELEARFCRAILPLLRFQRMPDRAESIPRPQQDTFDWIFRDRNEETNESPWASFTDWLQRPNDGVYWVTGKPGSGKSTLMKYLSSHNQVHSLLSKWSGGAEVKSGCFYFWNSGTRIQMSKLGLFRTLLYSCLKGDAALTRTALSERFEEFRAFGGGLYNFTWPELQRAFLRMISDESTKFFFLIDGLDEFDGNPKDIIDTVLGTEKPHVKILAASRPWLPFEDAFGKRPSLLLEKLTQRDIRTYVDCHFNENRFFVDLKAAEPQTAEFLVKEIVEKASGVFLWVYLVVDSLLEGLSNVDRIKDLEARLRALPSDLEALYHKLLRQVGPIYFKEACVFFRLHKAYRKLPYTYESPTLLELHYAEDDELESGISAPWTPLTYDAASATAELCTRRLKARCHGFLEVRTENGAKLCDSQVRYLHRTGRDYIESAECWNEVLGLTGHEGLKTDERWGNSFLMCRNMHPYAQKAFGKYRRQCLEHASYMREKTQLLSATYIDAAVAYDRSGTSLSGPRSAEGLEEVPLVVSIFFENVEFMTDYLKTVFARAKKEEADRMLREATKYLSSTSVSSVPKRELLKEMKRLKEVNRYFTSPPNRKWMLKKVAVPPYV